MSHAITHRSYFMRNYGFACVKEDPKVLTPPTKMQVQPHTCTRTINKAALQLRPITSVTVVA